MAKPITNKVPEQIIEVRGQDFYLIKWFPKSEIRIVNGFFVKGHWQKLKVLSEPWKSQRLLKLDYELNKESYGK